MSIAYSLGRGVTDNRPEQHECEDFAAFVGVLGRVRAKSKKSARYICCPLNGTGARSAEGALPRRFLAVDADRIAAARHPAFRQWFARFSGVAWSTHSSTPEAPRERVIIELSRPATRDECIALGAMLIADIADEFGADVELDPSTFRGEQPVFVPPTGAELTTFAGDPLDVDANLATARKAQAESPRQASRQPATDAIAAIRKGEGLHENIARLVASMAAKGVDREVVHVAAVGLVEHARHARGARVDEFAGDELRRLIDGALKKYAPPGAPDGVARSFDAADLLTMPMAEPNYIVRPFVPEGVTLWCGRPKVGKTTALRQLGIAANTGGTFLGERVAKSEVWFLSLEEGERLFRKKLAMMKAEAEQLRGITLEFEWPQAAAGVEQLRARLAMRTGTRPVLIIIDSLQRFRLPQTERGMAFAEDYNAAKLLAELCKDFAGLAIVVLHHTTKAVPDDPVAAISGTYGLTAAADSYAIMMKQGEQFRLHAGGRLWDRDASDFEIARAAGTWSLVGEWSAAAPAYVAPRQEQILAALRTGAKSSRALAEITGQSQSALSHLMGKLSGGGLVRRVANGWELA